VDEANPPRDKQRQRIEQRSYRLGGKRLSMRPGIDLDKALRLASESDDANTIEKHRRHT
jgi:hypothetical protein